MSPSDDTVKRLPKKRPAAIKSGGRNGFSAALAIVITIALAACPLFSSSGANLAVDAFVVPTTPAFTNARCPRKRCLNHDKRIGGNDNRINLVSMQAATEDTDSSEKVSVEETTEKYGLEVGLAQAAKEGDGESAKSLLKKYGIAYLATSIPLAIVSFSLCYLLVDNGVDIGALLSKVGIESTGTTDKAGTVAIAYAAHKAASPIRFPPTVLLTPVVAKMIGKEPEPEAQE